MYDGNRAPLERARERLVAHRPRAHLHVRDAWAEPDRAGRRPVRRLLAEPCPRDRLAAFLALVRRWLKPGGLFALIDSLPDQQSSAADHPSPTDDRSLRRLADGREFTIVKVYYTPAELRDALARAGFGDADVDDDQPLLPDRGRHGGLAAGDQGRMARPAAILRAMSPLRNRRSRPSVPASWPRR